MHYPPSGQGQYVPVIKVPLKSALQNAKSDIIWGYKDGRCMS